MFYWFVDLETTADETQDLVFALQDEVTLLEDLVSNLEAENTQLLQRLSALEMSVTSMNASTQGKRRKHSSRMRTARSSAYRGSPLDRDSPWQSPPDRDLP